MYEQSRNVIENKGSLKIEFDRSYDVIENKGDAFGYPTMLMKIKEVHESRNQKLEIGNSVRRDAAQVFQFPDFNTE